MAVLAQASQGHWRCWEDHQNSSRVFLCLFLEIGIGGVGVS